MSTNLTRYKADLQQLVALGSEMERDLAYKNLEERKALKEGLEAEAKKVRGSFEKNYQRWYTEALVVVKQLIPERLIEFEALYKGDGKRRTFDLTTYSIQDWLNGVRAGVNGLTDKKVFNDLAATLMRFSTQLKILQAVERRFESSLFDIRQVVQADLSDSELEGASELARNGFGRAAGAVAGVVLEKHLAQVCTNHNVALRKQHPTISDFNDLLKKGNVVDVPTWRLIQRLGDLRNLCDHSKGRDPTAEEVAELISGVEKLSKTVF